MLGTKKRTGDGDCELRNEVFADDVLRMFLIEWGHSVVTRRGGEDRR